MSFLFWFLLFCLLGFLLLSWNHTHTEMIRPGEKTTEQLTGEENHENSLN